MQDGAGPGSEGGRTCPRCGAPAAGTPFCTSCGEPLGQQVVQAPTEQVPAQQLPAQQVQAEQAPTEQVPQQVPAQQVPAQQVQAEQAPADEAPTEQVPQQAEQTPAADAPAPLDRALPTAPLWGLSDPATEPQAWDPTPAQRPVSDDAGYTAVTSATSVAPAEAHHGPSFTLTEPPLHEEEPEDPTSSGRRRTLVLFVAGAVALAVGIGGGGYAYARHQQGAPVRAALAASTPAFNDVVTGLASAADLAAVEDWAGQAEEAAETVAGLQETVPARDARSRAVVAQLEAEAEVLTAAAGLRGLQDEPLEVWSQAHSALRGSLEEERETREALKAVEADGAERLADTEPMLESLTEVVGGALVRDSTEAAEELLAGLREARTTAQVRDAATDAAARREAVESAVDGVAEDGGREVLEGYATALAALAPLATLNADSLGTWSAARQPFTEGMTSLASAAGSAGAGVRGQIAATVASLDALVVRAEEALADWQERTATARSEREAEVKAVEAYTTTVRDLLTQYDQQRVDLGDFTDRVDSGAVDAYDALSYLDGAYGARVSVRDALIAARPPTGLQREHDTLVGVVRRGVAGVNSAYQGVNESTSCFETCDFRSSSGWQVFQEESDEISDAYAKAVRAWEAAAAKARSATAARPLPPRPEV